MEAISALFGPLGEESIDITKGPFFGASVHNYILKFYVDFITYLRLRSDVGLAFDC